MSKYSPYIFNVDKVRKMATRAHAISHKLKGFKSVIAALTEIYSRAPEMKFTLEFIIHAEELAFLDSERVIYYPSSSDLCHAIFHTTREGLSENAYFDGQESFVISPPANLIIDNASISGILVTFMDHDDHRIKMIKKAGKMIGLSDVGVTADIKQISLAVIYLPDHKKNPYLYTRAVYDLELLINLSHITDPKKWALEMNKASVAHKRLGEVGLDLTDLIQQFYVFRLVLGIILYKKALPEMITTGLPGIGRMEAETIITKGATHKIIGATRSPSERTGHYRSWHYRALRHDKYYKGEHKNKKKGSRVILVKDSFINMEITAKTVN